MHRLTRRAWAEVFGVLVTGVLHLLSVHRVSKALFILVAVVGWSIYVGRRLRRDRRAAREWGLSSNGLRPTLRIAAALAAGGSAALAAIAVGRGSLHFHSGMIPMVLLFPIWGLVQEVLVQGMVVGHVVSAYPQLSRSPSLVVGAGLLFGAVHLPDPALTGATVLMGVFFAAVFVRYRNVWPLGLVHGTLGVLFYFWVLDRDPWRELLVSLGLA